MREKSRPTAPFFTRILLWLTLAVLYLPLVVLLIGAVYAPADGGGREWTWRWVQEVLQDDSLISALQNSLVVAVANSVLATLLGTMATLALFRLRGRWRLILDGLNMLSLVFPEIVFALALLSWFFVLHLQLGLLTVILAHITFSLSYVMMTVGARLSTLDPALEDAARDLGAGEGQILRRVTLPLLKPALLAGFILSFLLSFDDFLITYFVNGIGSDTLPVRLYASMKMGVTPKLNALASLMLLATVGVLLVLFRSKNFKILRDSVEKS